MNSVMMMSRISYFFVVKRWVVAHVFVLVGGCDSVPAMFFRSLTRRSGFTVMERAQQNPRTSNGRLVLPILRTQAIAARPIFNSEPQKVITPLPVADLTIAKDCQQMDVQAPIPSSPLRKHRAAHIDQIPLETHGTATCNERDCAATLTNAVVLVEPTSDFGFKGPVTVGGIFFAVDPHVSSHGLTSSRDVMNPNAQLTFRDGFGRAARARYSCRINGGPGGMKLEAMVRCQVGWIAPRVPFSRLPSRIRLGRGFDISIPFVCHFTVARVLDEAGSETKSFLFLSGTPMFGLSAGFVPIQDGEMTQNLTSPIDPEREASHFLMGVHYRQFGFLLFKISGYVVCAIAAWMNLAGMVYGVLHPVDPTAAAVSG